MTDGWFTKRGLTNYGQCAARYLTLLLIGSCSTSLSDVPSTSGEASLEPIAQVDPSGSVATSSATTDPTAATTNNQPNIEGEGSTLIDPQAGRSLPDYSMTDYASWVALAWPFLSMEELSILLDQLTNETVLDFLSPPSLPPSRPFLEQSCRNRGLPDFVCRQRYGP